MGWDGMGYMSMVGVVALWVLTADSLAARRQTDGQRCLRACRSWRHATGDTVRHRRKTRDFRTRGVLLSGPELTFAATRASLSP